MASGPFTVSIIGFPEDVKPREITNLVRSFPGFQTVTLQPSLSSVDPCTKPGPFQAIVAFRTAQEAITCVQSLNQYQFDLSMPGLLHASTTTHFDNLEPSAKRPRPSHMEPGAVSAQFQPNQVSTLFCGNLDGHVDDNEVRQVVQSVPGFTKIRFAGNRIDNTMIFMTFDCVESAASAKNVLQGLKLRSSSHPMRVQFAKQQTGSASQPVSSPYDQPIHHAPEAPIPTEGPITTLFVGNLDSDVLEQEAVDLFKTYPGYCLSRFTTASCADSPAIAFVSYDSVENATTALFGLKRHCLRTVPLRVKFARKQMFSPFNEQQGGVPQTMQSQDPYRYYPSIPQYGPPQYPPYMPSYY